jgi:putative lipoic acid-binding regulatory protein
MKEISKEISTELLKSTHDFPTRYDFKVIGTGENFEEDSWNAISGELENPELAVRSVRFSKEKKHISVTLNVIVKTPEEVNALYKKLAAVPGVILLL